MSFKRFDFSEENRSSLSNPGRPASDCCQQDWESVSGHLKKKIPFFIELCSSLIVWGTADPSASLFDSSIVLCLSTNRTCGRIFLSRFFFFFLRPGEMWWKQHPLNVLSIWACADQSSDRNSTAHLQQYNDGSQGLSWNWPCVTHSPGATTQGGVRLNATPPMNPSLVILPRNTVIFHW